MAEKLAIICAALILFSCASTGSTGTGSSAMTEKFLVTVPRSRALTIIGVSGPLQKREDEIAAAREDAARKAAMYHGMIARYEFVHATGSGIFDYRSESNLKINYDEYLEPYIEKLRFNQKRDLATRDNTVFIRFTYPTVFPGSINYRFAVDKNGRPEWVTHRPLKINGFIAGVGLAQRQYRRQDTFIKSYEAALVEILYQLSIEFSQKEISGGNWNTSTINAQGTGNLSNFLVLEIWIDPATQAVWTLAIAQSAE